MDNLTFSLTRVSKALSKKPVYRAVVQTNAVLGHEELAERMAERTKQDAALWKYFLDVLSDEIETQLLAGNRVNLGRIAMFLAIRGAFDSEDDDFDPTKHKLAAIMRPQKGLREAMDAIVPENVTKGISCVIGSAMDAVTKRLSEITGTNLLLIQGMRLGISPDNPDEGVWLADPKTGRVVARAKVTKSGDQIIDCVFLDPPAPGLYTLVVSCRNGARETISPAVARIKNFKVLASGNSRQPQRLGL